MCSPSTANHLLFFFCFTQDTHNIISLIYGGLAKSEIQYLSVQQQSEAPTQYLSVYVAFFLEIKYEMDENCE